MEKKKKIILLITILIIILVLIIAVIATSIAIEDRKVGDIYSKENYEAKSIRYVELKDLPLDYNFTDMVADGCYIIMNTDIVYNVSKFEKFMKDVESNVPSEVRVVQWTVEGEPVITDLEYTKEKFIIKHDNRRDHFSIEKDRVISIEEYDTSKYKLIKENSGQNVTAKTEEMIYLKSNENIGDNIYLCTYIKKAIVNEDFQLVFDKDANQKKANLILDSSKFGYNIYSYQGSVSVIINNKKISLKDALDKGKISPNDILEKAKKDAQNKIIWADTFRDGGSYLYIYDNYAILKLHSLMNTENKCMTYNEDLYIGPPSMNINDIK